MRVILRIIVIVLLGNLSFGAIYGGWILISDPSGEKFGWTIEILNGTPFHNFLIPGIILVSFNGILPFVIAVLTLIKSRFHEWLIILQGCILIVWLTAEIIFNTDFFEPVLHYPSYATGLLLVILGLVLLIKYKTRYGKTI